MCDVLLDVQFNTEKHFILVTFGTRKVTRYLYANIHKAYIPNPYVNTRALAYTYFMCLTSREESIVIVSLK